MIAGTVRLVLLAQLAGISILSPSKGPERVEAGLAPGQPPFSEALVVASEVVALGKGLTARCCLREADDRNGM